MDKKNNDGKSISFVLIGILTIVVAIAGSTYAYFSATVSNNTVISGESAYVAAPFTLTVTHSTGSKVGSKYLVPQKDEFIQNAIYNETIEEEAKRYIGCVDGNGNAVCKVYTITIKNNTTTKYYITGTLSFNITGTMSNLKWALGTSATQGFPSSTNGPFYTPNTVTSSTPNSSKTTQTDVLEAGTEIAGNASKSYYVVIWISETGAAQTDSGKFTSTVSFDGYNDSSKAVGGISSTIRS